MRGRPVLLPVAVILSLLLGSAPSLALAQDSVGADPDRSLVELASDDCSWLNAGDEDVVALVGPVTCGTLAVPENWPAPGERRLEIEFVILEQTGDDPAADPVVYLAGGPGGSSLNGVPYYAELFASPATEDEAMAGAAPPAATPVDAEAAAADEVAQLAGPFLA
nr:hypothetical protein [Chloroflexia bacterium]